MRTRGGRHHEEEGREGGREGGRVSCLLVDEMGDEFDEARGH